MTWRSPPARPSVEGRSPPSISIRGFNPTMGVGQGLPPRSDAGREILSILSTRREEQARSWAGAQTRSHFSST
jgi:hypothetical protein